MTPFAPSEVPPASRRSRTPLIVAIVVAVLVLATGGIAVALTFQGDKAPAPYNVTGSMAIPWDSGTHGQDCRAGGGYSDITAAQVVFSDEAGVTLAITQLPAMGKLNMNAGSPRCTFEFSAVVPGGHQFYGVEVGRRGRLKYPAEKMTEPFALVVR